MWTYGEKFMKMKQASGLSEVLLKAGRILELVCVFYLFSLGKKALTLLFAGVSEKVD